MKIKGLEDLLASQMDANLSSSEHQALFASDYKMAKEDCSKCHKHPCKCSDSHSADDDNDARRKKHEDSSEKSSDSQSADDANDAKKKKQESKDSDSDESKADDTQDAKSPAPIESLYDVHHADDDDDDDADDDVVQAYNAAIGSLLTASAALDAVGLEKSSALSLSLAGFVVEAKKKVKDKKKSKKSTKPKSKSTSSKSDSNDARAKKKKEDSKDSKKSDSKSSKK